MSRLRWAGEKSVFSVTELLDPNVKATWENVRFALESKFNMVELPGKRTKGGHTSYLIALPETEHKKPQGEPRYVVGDRTPLALLCGDGEGQGGETVVLQRRPCLGSDRDGKYNRHVPEAMVGSVLKNSRMDEIHAIQRLLEWETDEAERLRLIMKKRGLMYGVGQPTVRRVPHPSRNRQARGEFAGYIDATGARVPWPGRAAAPADHHCDYCFNYFVDNPTAPEATPAPHFYEDCPARDVEAWTPMRRRGWASGCLMSELERIPWDAPFETICAAPYYNNHDGMLYCRRSPHQGH